MTLPLDGFRGRDEFMLPPRRTRLAEVKVIARLGRALFRAWVDLVAGRQRCPICTSRHLLPMSIIERPYLIHCRRCQVIFRGGRPSTDELMRYYTQTTRDPSMAFSPRELEEYCGHKHWCYRELGFEQHEARLGPSRRALDVGCGSGLNLEVLCRRGWVAEGIDPNPAQVERARQGGKSAEVTHLDLAARDPARVGRYDLVTLFHVIEHLPDPLSTMRAAAALLRDGGLLLVETPLCCDLYNVEHLFFFTRASLEHLLGRAGFQVCSQLLYVSARTAHDCLLLLARKVPAAPQPANG